MKTNLLSLFAAALLASPAFAQDPAEATKPITRQDIVKMSMSGLSDDVILAKIDQDKPIFALKADDIADLKKLGVSERVIQRMLATAPAATPAPSPSAPPSVVKDANAIVKNSSFLPLFLTVDEKEKTFSVSKSQGTELKVDQSLSWKLAEGAWTIAIEGNGTIDTFTVADAEHPVKLTLNGAKTDTVEVVTLITEDRNGRIVSIIDSVGKLTEGQRRRDPRIRPPGQYVGMYGPKFVYMPYISSNILLGAGVGAIIGHRSGHTAEGALIGATAGLLIDHTPWIRVRW